MADIILAIVFVIMFCKLLFVTFHVVTNVLYIALGLLIGSGLVFLLFEAGLFAWIKVFIAIVIFGIIL